MVCFIECVTAEPIVAVLNNFDKSMQFTNMLGQQLILPFLHFWMYFKKNNIIIIVYKKERLNGLHLN